MENENSGFENDNYGVYNDKPRFLLGGMGNIDSLSDIEMVSIVANISHKKALELLNIAGGLEELYKLTIEDLCSIKGINEKKALSLKVAFGLAKRVQQRYSEKHNRIEHPADVTSLLREEFRGKSQEEFWILCLDARHNVIKYKMITLGIADRCIIHSREIFMFAIKSGATRIILAHNHPTGDPTPSRNDIDLTSSVVAAGKIIGIEVLDHVIVGKMIQGSEHKEWVSLRELNLL
jgi:DNA repair protein RadC